MLGSLGVLYKAYCFFLFLLTTLFWSWKQTSTYLQMIYNFMLDIFSVESAARINRDVERIYAWGVLWNALINPVKTSYMIVTNRFITYPTVYFKNIPVDYTISHSHLGLI